LKTSRKTLQKINRFILTEAFVEEVIEDKNKHGSGMENPSG
jgi:hypothetical protein